MQNPGPRTEALSEVLPPDVARGSASPLQSTPADQRTLMSGAESTAEPSLTPTLPGYEILQALGRGGMGVVYQARQTALNRLVALKMLLTGHLASQEARLRFLIEAEIIARVRHPNIVQIYEFGTYQEQPFLALEYVDGGSLADHLHGQPLPPIPAARLIEILARAIHAAHLQGIVHRDLKPANVLLMLHAEGRMKHENEASSSLDIRHSAYGIPKITDFGLAKLQGAADLTQTGAILGTPHYMAPEQADSGMRQIGPATDVFALGTILFEMLTGVPPFKDAHSVGTILKLTTTEAPPVLQLQPKTPRDLATICQKCLEKQPSRRYGSAEALADDLARFLRDEPIHARPVSAAERVWRWCRRNPVLAGLMSMVVLSLAAALVTFLWLAQERAARAEEEARDLAAQMARRAETTRLVNQALDEAKALQSQAERSGAEPFTWMLALAAARRAEGYATDADPDLRRRASETLRELESRAGHAQARQAQEARDRQMVERLEELRLQMSAGRRDQDFQWRTVESGFETAFRQYGIDAAHLEEAEASRRIQERPADVVLALAIGLDYWVYAGWASAWEDASSADGTRLPNFLTMAGKLNFWRKLLALAKAVDPDPLRGRLRDAIAHFNVKEFSRLARSPEFLNAPPATQAMAAQILTKIDKPDVVFALLHEAHRRRPDDFWLNFRLANYHTFLPGSPSRAEGLRFATAALALRPEDPMALQTYGYALFYAERSGEAIQVLREYLQRRPRHAVTWSHLGYMLADTNQPAEAEKCFRRSLELQPNSSSAHYNLGAVLETQARWAEALASYREAIRHSPEYYLPHRSLARLLARQGRVDEAIAAYQTVLRLRPRDADSQRELKRLQAQKTRGG